MMDLAKFSRSNRERCESSSGFNHAVNAWSFNDWYTAASGELGELGNVLKKIRRLESGTTHRTQEADRERLQRRAEEEIGDAFIYLDLLATRMGIDFGEVIRDKWNATSAEIGYPRAMVQDGDTILWEWGG